MKFLLQRLIFSLFLRSGAMDKTNRKAVLLFQLGSLQVYHFQTPEEITRNDPYKDVYWQDVSTRRTYGPFKSINEAMIHYTWLIATQKTDAKGSIGNVIYMDFKNKKRVIVGGNGNETA